MIRNLLDNWKTTSAGLLAISAAILRLIFIIKAGNADEATWMGAITGVVAGIGLISAGDASKSKQDVQAVDAKVDQTTAAVVTGNTSLITNQPTKQP